MANFDGDMNVEAQLQVAYSTNAELLDQIDVLNKTIWSQGGASHVGREQGRIDAVL